MVKANPAESIGTLARRVGKRRRLVIIDTRGEPNGAAALEDPALRETDFLRHVRKIVEPSLQTAKALIVRGRLEHLVWGSFASASQSSQANRSADLHPVRRKD